jgi:hypothetical protein
MAAYTLPLNYEFTVYSGTSYQREFRWLPDGTNPIDFTGWSALMLIGQQLAEAQVELSTDNGGIQLTSQGQILVTMTPFQTAALTGPLTYYNLDLIEPDGFVRRFLRGRVSVAVDVKKPRAATP